MANANRIVIGAAVQTSAATRGKPEIVCFSAALFDRMMLCTAKKAPFGPKRGTNKLLEDELPQLNFPSSFNDSDPPATSPLPTAEQMCGNRIAQLCSYLTSQASRTESKECAKAKRPCMSWT